MMKLFREYAATVKGFDDVKKTFIAVISDDSVDRYDEVVSISAWSTNALKNYMKHPVLLVDHNYSTIGATIGKALRIWTEGNLVYGEFEVFVGKNNQQADWAWELVKLGIAAFSIGFQEEESHTPSASEWAGDEIPRRVYDAIELLEVSMVVLPANQNAIQNALKSKSAVIKSIAEKIKETKSDLMGGESGDDDWKCNIETRISSLEMWKEDCTENPYGEEDEEKPEDKFIKDLNGIADSLKARAKAISDK